VICGASTTVVGCGVEVTVGVGLLVAVAATVGVAVGTFTSLLEPDEQAITASANVARPAGSQNRA
jgi:hypothetical protein